MASRDNSWAQVQDPLLRGILERMARRLDEIDVLGTAIPPRSITSAMIALSAITTILIADSAITLAKLAAGLFTADAAGRAKFANGFVNTALIADDAVDKAKIAADVAGLGLSQAVGGELDVNVDASTVEINADTLRVKDGGITAPKLADSLAALIQGTPTLTPGGSAAAPATISVTCQLKDADGTNLAAQTLVRAWLSDSTTGGQTGTVADAFTVTTGTVLSSTLAGADISAISDAAGAITFSVQRLVGAQTWYLRLEYQGTIYTSTAITFT